MTKYSPAFVEFIPDLFQAVGEGAALIQDMKAQLDMVELKLSTAVVESDEDQENYDAAVKYIEEAKKNIQNAEAEQFKMIRAIDTVHDLWKKVHGNDS